MYLILFEDSPDAPADLRQRHMARHLAFLKSAGCVRMAGPLAEAGVGAGGAWMVDCATAEEAEALVRADPFFPTGLRASWRVLEWRLVHQG